MSELSQSHKDEDELVRLSYFIDIAKSISQSNSIDAILTEVMAHINNIFSPKNWSLLLKEKDKDELRFVIVNGDIKHPLLNKTLPINEGVAGWIASNNESMIIDDVKNNSHFSDRFDKNLDFETTSIIGVPLSSGNKVFGVIELINKINGDNFNHFELKLLTTIAEFSGIAIEKIYYNEYLQKLSLCDHLTGLYNKTSFDEFLQNEIQQKERYGTFFSLLIININHFRILNDTFGHDAGDQVINTLANIIKLAIRDVDKASRYQGDEFIIILHHTHHKDSQIIINRILKLIEQGHAERKSNFYEISTACIEADAIDKTQLLDKLYTKLNQNRN